jgi:S-(hydroxymethyl)glutathione dehydrogenase / alcohol dehydrogenase
MKAAIFEKAGQPLVIDDVDIVNPRAGEVMVRTVCSGVCHSDLHFVDGLWPLPMDTILGHEAAGVVEKIGEGVSYVKPGDKVIMSFKPFCGKCYYCMRGQGHLCNDAMIGASAAGRITRRGKPVLQMANVGSFAELMVTHESGVVKVPDQMPMAEAALVGCGVMTGVGAAINTAKVTPGSSVAVFGCGGVGLSIIQGARLAGAAKIIAVDVADKKLEMARHFGATHTVNGAKESSVMKCKELTGGQGPDFTFEAVGIPSLMLEAHAAGRRRAPRA